MGRRTAEEGLGTRILKIQSKEILIIISEIGETIHALTISAAANAMFERDGASR